MARFSGRRTSIGVAKDSSRGNTASSAEYWIPYASYSYTEKVLKIKDESGLGTLATPQGSDIVKEWTEGELTMHIRDLSIGLFLLSLYGAESFAQDTPESNVGTHTFTLAESNQHQSLTIFKKDPVETLASPLTMVTSFQVQAVLDQYAQITVGLMGKKFGADVETVAYVAENKFRPQDLSIKLASAGSDPTGASAQGTVRSIDFTANKNIEEYQGLGSKALTDILNKDFVCSGNMEVLFEAETFKNYVLGDSNQNRSMALEFQNLQAIAGGTTNPKLSFIFDEVVFNEFTQDYENSNLVMVSLSFEMVYNMNNARMHRAILINGRNSAY